jgi:very-short-patch-repair endonuclease
MARDFKRNQQLIPNGWTLLRIWESDIYISLEEIVDNIRMVLNNNN